MWGRFQQFHFTDGKTNTQLREGQQRVVLSEPKSFIPPQVPNTHKSMGPGKQQKC